jgi:hypothetical protein
VLRSAIDLERRLVGVSCNSFCLRLCCRGLLTGFVPLTAATATSATATPATAAVGSGSALPESLGTVGLAFLDRLLWRIALFSLISRLDGVGRGGILRPGLAFTIASAVSPVAAATSSTVPSAVSPVGTLLWTLLASGSSLERYRLAASTVTVVAAATLRTLCLEVGRVAGLFHKVCDVEEGIPLEADVDEAGLHARQNARHAAVIDGPREGVFILALVIDFRESVIFDDGKPRLVRRARYIDFFRHSFLLFLPKWAADEAEKDRNWPSRLLGVASRWCGQDGGDVQTRIHDDRDGHGEE